MYSKGSRKFLLPLLDRSTFFFGDDATVDLRGAMRVNLASDPVPLLAQLGWAVAPPQAEHRPPP